MKKIGIIISFLLTTILSSFTQDSTSTILLDKRTISGIGLEKISPNWAAADRKLFTKNVFSGQDLVVNVTSSSNAFHDWKNYSIDEFVYVLNGQAIIESKTSEKSIFNKGEFFIVPKGFTGRWTTKGKQGNFLELAIYSKQRRKRKDEASIEPYSLEKLYLSGIESHNDNYFFEGIELVTFIKEQMVNSTEQIERNDSDKVIFILNGSVNITNSNKQVVSYYSGDFYIIPKGFKGKINYQGFDIYRELIVEPRFSQ